MPQCFVLNCGNYYSKTRPLSRSGQSIIYHVFPSCKRDALIWASLCRGEEVSNIPPYARVCSTHFSPKNYQRDLQHELLGLPTRRKLAADAAPDLYLPDRIIKEEIINEESGKEKLIESTKKRRLSTGNKSAVHKSVIVKNEQIVGQIDNRKASPKKTDNESTKNEIVKRSTRQSVIKSENCAKEEIEPSLMDFDKTVDEIDKKQCKNVNKYKKKKDGQQEFVSFENVNIKTEGDCKLEKIEVKNEIKLPVKKRKCVLSNDSDHNNFNAVFECEKNKLENMENDAYNEVFLIKKIPEKKNRRKSLPNNKVDIIQNTQSELTSSDFLDPGRKRPNRKKNESPKTKKSVINPLNVVKNLSKVISRQKKVPARRGSLPAKCNEFVKPKIEPAEIAPNITAQVEMKENIDAKKETVQLKIPEEPSLKLEKQTENIVLLIGYDTKIQNPKNNPKNVVLLEANRNEKSKFKNISARIKNKLTSSDKIFGTKKISPTQNLRKGVPENDKNVELSRFLPLDAIKHMKSDIKIDQESIISSTTIKVGLDEENVFVVVDDSCESVAKKPLPKLQEVVRLPVRSSIRIAQRKSIELTSQMEDKKSDGVKRESDKKTKSKSDNGNSLNQKLKFLSTLGLKLKTKDAKKKRTKSRKGKCGLQLLKKMKTIKAKRMSNRYMKRFLRKARREEKKLQRLNRMLVMEEAGEVQDTPKTDHDCSQKDSTSPKQRIASSDIAEDLSNNCQRNGVDNPKTTDDTKTDDSNKCETKENSKTNENLEETANTKMKKEDVPKKETRNSEKENNGSTSDKSEKDAVVIENANKLVDKESENKNADDVVCVTASESGKRSIEESNGPPLKKSKIESLNDLREDIVSEFVESASSTLDDIQQQETKLVADIEYLDETARAKEREWNDIIRLKKLKEEILLRLQRKRQVILISSDSHNDNIDWELALDMHIKSLSNDNGSNQSGASVQSLNLAAINLSNSSVTVLPVSSSNSLPKRNAKSIDSKLRNVKKAYSPNERSLLAATLNRQRSILPKPSYNLPSNSYDYNSTSKTGPKGQPMMDVNLIVEKFRQNHPEEVPRRGRRVKSIMKNETDIVSSSSRQSVLSSLQGAPSRVDLNSELGMMLTTGSDGRNRSSNSSNDSTQNHSNSETASAPSSSGGNVSFKDVLVQFARLSQAERRDVLSSSQPSTTTSNNFVLQRGNTTIAIKPPPPPYPEVTLHPVLGSGGTVVSSSQSSTSNSLLHGILTKNQQPSPESSKPFTALSPTLARLLTGSASQPSDVSDISDLLNNPQNQAKVPSPRRQTQSLSPPRSSQSLIRVPRTSAQVITSSVHSSQFQPPAGVVNLDDMETEDSADRLVIDESHEATENQQNKGSTEDGAEVASDSAGSSGQVPPCQGCKENPAQFVCAGCTSQWYCSRECQVSDWDDHSEMCSG